MSIRLAFSTLACPQWTLTQAIEQAKAMGYQGIELVTRFGRNTPDLACDPHQQDAAEIREKLKQAGIEAVCLSTNVSLTVKGHDHEQAAMQMARSAILQAAAIGAPMVRLLAWDVPAGEIVRQTLARVATQARELADFAGSQGIQILLENNGAIATGRDWWWCMDMIRHPMVALSWNVRSAALAGEKPAISIPMLNSRIRLVKLTDFTETGRPVQLGDGQLGAEKVLHRLMGIGYSGFVSVEWDRLSDASLASAEEVLPEARTRLTGWLDAVAQAAESKKPPRKTLPAAAAAIAAKAAASKAVVAKPAGDASPEAEAAEAVSTARSLPDAAAIRAAKIAAAQAQAEARRKAKAEEEAASQNQSGEAGAAPADTPK